MSNYDVDVYLLTITSYNMYIKNTSNIRKLHKFTEAEQHNILKMSIMSTVFSYLVIKA